ncbi:type II toxin-antitoxin system RatA family toxin [Sulfuricaulis sp.]|jgi:coenzyme Q-binding protein COQ10|uniref:type II toxin-antitoxin system RatA family toxin n=1 Tax=Sulfuricaulis sp. TaxID=2003553 RepID=UPI00355AC4CA
MTTIHRSALVPYSAHQMFELVADIPSYPKFLPWCGGARIVSTEGDEVIAAIDIAYSGVHRTFSTRNLLQRDKMMEIQLLEGPFSYLQGFWQFKALDEQSSKISLDLEFDVANRIVGLALTPVFSNIANQLVDRFHRRATELYGKPA